MCAQLQCCHRCMHSLCNAALWSSYEYSRISIHICAYRVSCVRAVPSLQTSQHVAACRCTGELRRVSMPLTPHRSILLQMLGGSLNARCPVGHDPRPGHPAARDDGYTGQAGIGVNHQALNYAHAAAVARGCAFSLGSGLGVTGLQVSSVVSPRWLVAGPFQRHRSVVDLVYLAVACSLHCDLGYQPLLCCNGASL